MFVPSPHRAIRRRAPRLSSFTASVWALLLAACGGGGGGGGSGGSAPVASGPVVNGPVVNGPVAPDSEVSTPGDPDSEVSTPAASDPVAPEADAQDADAPDPEQPLRGSQAPAGDNVTPPDPGSPSNDPQHREDSPSDARQVETQAVDSVPARMEILPLVSLPARPSAAADQWIRIADIRVLNSRGEAIEGDWSYSVDDSRFHADSEGLHVRAGSDFSRLVSENLNVQITVRGTPDQQISQTAEVEIVDRAESLEESDFLLDGGDLLLVQWPDVT